MAVGVVYDDRMCAHKDPHNKSHPEQPARITSIWKALQSSGVVKRCVRVEAREATVEELTSVHSEEHVEKMKAVSSRSFGSERRSALARSYNSIYFNSGSSSSALLSAGSVVELALRVASGELSSGAAVVRPPGHHAEADQAMGFCLFNNVAVAAHILSAGKVAGIKKILVVDWDIHHGNGTQHMFWKDPNVLYFSVHRYDDGFFYPGGEDGRHDKVGEGAGAGFNMNVPWPRGGYGDADYVAVWEHVLMPVARDFNPDIVLISAGFDSALGDPLGGCKVTPLGYTVLTQQLMELAGGKVVLALEGGYNLDSIAKSYLACVQVLLGDIRAEEYSTEEAFDSTGDIIQKVRNELSRYWHVLSGPVDRSISRASREYLPLPPEESESSEEDEQQAEQEVLEETKDELVAETNKLVALFEKLATENSEEVQLRAHVEVLATESGGVESVHETVEWSVDLRSPAETRNPRQQRLVWYATYGSNMWPSRLKCYIQGGQVEGGQKKNLGLQDKSPPLGDYWLTAPHRLFFGREGTQTWGAGGVAFLDPTPSDSESHLRAYKITLDQFNGILAQENRLEPVITLISPRQIEGLKNPPHSLELLEEDAWYGTVLYLGDNDGIPVLTITCSAASVERFKRGELPVCSPSAEYEKTIVKGLLQKRGLSEQMILEYIRHRALSPL